MDRAVNNASGGGGGRSFMDRAVNNRGWVGFLEIFLGCVFWVIFLIGSFLKFEFINENSSFLKFLRFGKKSDPNKK